MRFRRDTRFDSLSRRQLELFAADEADLLDEAAEAEARWIETGRDDAEEVYGDYQLVVDAIADRLLDIRETYAASLEGPAADAYRTAFTRAARRSFSRYASLLEDLESD